MKKPVAAAPKTAKVEVQKTAVVHKKPAKAPAKKKA